MAFYYNWNTTDKPEKIKFEEFKGKIAELKGTGDKIYVGINAKRKLPDGRWLKIKTAGRNIKWKEGLMKEVPADKLVYAVVEEGKEEYLIDVELICGGYEKFKELMELAGKQHEYFLKRDTVNRRKASEAIDDFPLNEPRIKRKKRKEQV